MKKIPVFFASDDYYAPFMATAMVSILDNSSSFFAFYVLDSGITIENKKRIENIKKIYDHFSIEYISIDIEKEFGHFPLHYDFHTLNVFSRYLIPIVKPDLDKVLYIDADIIVLGDLAELYCEDLGVFHLGAVPAYSDAMFRHQIDLGLPYDNQYFNAGILLIDCKYFRDNNITDILIEETLRIKPDLQDQDVLNIHFENNYKILDCKYNVTQRMYEYLKNRSNQNVQNALDNPFIIHYIIKKPWADLSAMYVEYFWKYLCKTEFFTVVLLKYLGENLEEQKKIERMKMMKFLEKERESLRLKNEEILALRNSKTFLIGDLFFRSIRSPRKMITFPFNLLRTLNGEYLKK